MEICRNMAYFKYVENLYIYIYFKISRILTSTPFEFFCAFSMKSSFFSFLRAFSLRIIGGKLNGEIQKANMV